MNELLGRVATYRAIARLVQRRPRQMRREAACQLGSAMAGAHFARLMLLNASVTMLPDFPEIEAISGKSPQ
jgi:hypothetical protein